MRKYHTMLHSVFERALRDRVITFNPCAHTELPKAVKKQARTLTPTEYAAILAALPAQHRLMIETAIDTGLRWGELVALRPRHLDLETGNPHRPGDHRGGLHQELPHRPTDARQALPQGQRTPHPRPAARAHSTHSPPTSPRRPRPGDLLFATRDGTPLSRNTFRTRIWLPAVQVSGVDFDVRVHDLRHAHASWLLAGGSDLKSVMDRMGHAQITTTQKYLHALPDADQRTSTPSDASPAWSKIPNRPLTKSEEILGATTPVAAVTRSSSRSNPDDAQRVGERSELLIGQVLNQLLARVPMSSRSPPDTALESPGNPGVQSALQ